MIKRITLTLLLLAACAQIAQAQQEDCFEQDDPKSATFCYGISATIEVAPAIAHSAEIEGYLWQQCSNLQGDWEEAAGVNTEANYTIPTLEKSMYYRRMVFGKCKDQFLDTIYSAPALITVLPAFTAGAIHSKEVNTNGESLVLNITDSISASGGDERITYRWKMDNQVITGEKPNLEINTATLSAGAYLFTREAKDATCAGGWIASEGYWKVTIPSSQPPLCNLNPNEIVAKREMNGAPYMLIYPNPDRALQYQWYKDAQPIANANAQFYYPSDGKLQPEAKYKVEIWEAHDATCRNFTDIYSFSGYYNAPCITVTPNPVTNNELKLSFNQDLLQNNSGAYRLAIYSSFGEKIWEDRINDLNDITISKQMHKGIYFITLIIDNKQYTEKVIVQ